MAKKVAKAVIAPSDPVVEKVEAAEPEKVETVETEAPKKKAKEQVIPDTLTQEQMAVTIQVLAKDRGIFIDLDKPWYDAENVAAFKSLTLHVHGLVYSMVPDYSIQPESTKNHLRGRFASM